MSEIARNSVLQSDFEHRFKAHFLGNNYWIRGVAGNDLRQTNVPSIRIQFRADLLNEELELLSNQAEKPITKALMESLWL
jgi:AMP deaminase